jgi:hypothetical protein
MYGTTIYSENTFFEMQGRKMRILLLLLLCWIGCLNNADDKYYGSVKLSLLTELTWMDVEQNVVGKFIAAREERPEAWDIKWYSCKM